MDIDPSVPLEFIPLGSGAPKQEEYKHKPSSSSSSKPSSSRDRRRSRSKSPSRRHSQRSRSRSPRRDSGKKRSPSPVKPKLKRSNLWDKAPDGFEGMNVAQVAKINPGVLMPLLANQNPQASRQARRLYIGNIPPSASEAEIMEFFNTAMVTAKVSKVAGNPIVSSQINAEKSFAFIEFRSAEDATSGLMFDGITLQGHALKIRRPRDYQAPSDTPPAPAIPIIPAVYPDPYLPGIVSTNVADTPNKIFVGGLPTNLTEEQVKELVSSYGQLKAFNLVKDTITGFSKGYAFFEYLDESVTDRACVSLNGMKLGEKTLLVQRAVVGAKNLPVQMAPNVVRPLTNPIATNLLTLTIPIQTIFNSLTAGSGTLDPTRVLLLLNCVSAEDLLTDNDYYEILEDITEEASKFGKVVSVFIPRPSPDPMTITQGVGKVFIEYVTADHSQTAQQSLAGRKFNKRTVITTYYPEDLYTQGKYEGPDEGDTQELQ